MESLAMSSVRQLILPTQHHAHTVPSLSLWTPCVRACVCGIVPLCCPWSWSRPHIHFIAASSKGIVCVQANWVNFAGCWYKRSFIFLSMLLRYQFFHNGVPRPHGLISLFFVTQVWRVKFEPSSRSLCSVMEIAAGRRERGAGWGGWGRRGGGGRDVYKELSK